MKDFLYILTRLIYLVPPIQMLVLFILSLIEWFTPYRFSQDFLINLGLYSGLSWLALLVYLALFFNAKLRYCLFTRCMVVGLALNQILNQISPLIKKELYDQLYTIISFTIAFVGYLILLYRNKK